MQNAELNVNQMSLWCFFKYPVYCGYMTAWLYPDVVILHSAFLILPLQDFPVELAEFYTLSLDKGLAHATTADPVDADGIIFEI